MLREKGTERAGTGEYDKVYPKVQTKQGLSISPHLPCGSLRPFHCHSCPETCIPSSLIRNTAPHLQTTVARRVTLHAAAAATHCTPSPRNSQGDFTI